jgi:hypothetical protein
VPARSALQVLALAPDALVILSEAKDLSTRSVRWRRDWPREQEILRFAQDDAGVILR